jgi:hypothetical protein
MAKAKKRKRKKPVFSPEVLEAKRARFLDPEFQAKMQERRKRNRELREAGVAVDLLPKHRLSWDGELSRNPSWADGIREFKESRNYEVAGFLRHVIAGGVLIQQRTASGDGIGGVAPMVPRPWQMDMYRDVVNHRLSGSGRWMELILKGRQIGASTVLLAMLYGDVKVNPGGLGLMTAQENATMDLLFEKLKTMLGRKKDAEGEIHRLSAMERVVELGGGSQIRFNAATTNFARGGTLTHLAVSEADYIADLDSALRSAMSAVLPAPWATITMESTLSRDSSSDFRAFVEQERDRQNTQRQPWERDRWRVRFLPWLVDPDSRIQMTEEETRAFLDSVDHQTNSQADYERELMEKHGATPEQVAWWRNVFITEARGNMEKMLEIQPTTLDEALTSSRSTAYYSPESIMLYKSMVRQPKKRFRAMYDGLRETGDAFSPNIAVWLPPKAGGRYVVGADQADADQRVHEEGSECAAVCLDIDSGEVVAEYSGAVNIQEFGVAVFQMAKYYNYAHVVPETPVNGQGLLDFLMETLGYSNVFERKQYGRVEKRVSGVYGFNPAGHAKSVILGRLQENINRKTLAIYSEKLVDQLERFGKRRGKVVRSGNKAPHDDLVIALALCMEGHENAVGNRWAPKDSQAVQDAHVDGTLDPAVRQMKRITLLDVLDERARAAESRDMVAHRAFWDG